LGPRPIDSDPAPPLPQSGEGKIDFVFLHERPRECSSQLVYRALAASGDFFARKCAGLPAAPLKPHLDRQLLDPAFRQTKDPLLRHRQR
jgi:hypothetical protein